MRVAVVGTGIVGACVGQALARRGAQVMMIDAGEPGAGVTKWSFSWVNASNKTHTRSYFDLNVAGTAAYEDLVLELGSSEWWHQTGHLRWCDDDRAATSCSRRWSSRDPGVTRPSCGPRAEYVISLNQKCSSRDMTCRSPGIRKKVGSTGHCWCECSSATRSVLVRRPISGARRPRSPHSVAMWRA
jgi:hypothetical protein